MTLRVALVIDGDATGAKSAIDQTAQGLKQLAPPAQAAAGSIGAIAPQAQAAAGAIDKVNLLTSYLIRNFSEMANMLISGRSPFQVLLTQGLQITRVFGPGVGVAGAMKQLGGGPNAPPGLAVPRRGAAYQGLYRCVGEQGVGRHALRRDMPAIALRAVREARARRMN